MMLQTKTDLKFSASLSQYFRCLTVYFFMEEYNRMWQASGYWFILFTSSIFVVSLALSAVPRTSGLADGLSNLTW